MPEGEPRLHVNRVFRKPPMPEMAPRRYQELAALQLTERVFLQYYSDTRDPASLMALTDWVTPAIEAACIRAEPVDRLRNAALLRIDHQANKRKNKILTEADYQTADRILRGLARSDNGFVEVGVDLTPVYQYLSDRAEDAASVGRKGNKVLVHRPSTAQPESSQRKEARPHRKAVREIAAVAIVAGSAFTIFGVGISKMASLDGPITHGTVMSKTDTHIPNGGDEYKITILDCTTPKHCKIGTFPVNREIFDSARDGGFIDLRKYENRGIVGTPPYRGSGHYGGGPGGRK